MIRKTSYQEKYYSLRKQTIERVFADAKDKHGCRYTRYRGLHKVQDYSYLLRYHEHEKDCPMVITFILHGFVYIHHFIRFQQFQVYKNGISPSDEFLTPYLSAV